MHGDRLFCCICRKEVPEDRLIRQAVTCSKDCAKRLKAIRRHKRDLKKCRYCSQPSSPEERKLFKQWRASQPDKPKRGRPRLPKPEAQSEFTEMMHIG